MLNREVCRTFLSPMLRMEGNAIAYATQSSARSAQGTILFNMVKVSQSFGELTTHCWGSTTGDQPARQVGPGQCCQATVLYDDAGQAIMETGEVNPLEASSTASRWWSTLRDYPAFHANRDHEKGFLKTGEVVNPRCNENRGSAAQHF